MRTHKTNRQDNGGKLSAVPSASNAKDNRSWPLFSREFGPLFSNRQALKETRAGRKFTVGPSVFPGAALNSGFCCLVVTKQSNGDERHDPTQKAGAIGHSSNGAEKSGE
jgi:hypothetical protein